MQLPSIKSSTRFYVSWTSGRHRADSGPTSAKSADMPLSSQHRPDVGVFAGTYSVTSQVILNVSNDKKFSTRCSNAEIREVMWEIQISNIRTLHGKVHRLWAFFPRSRSKVKVKRWNILVCMERPLQQHNSCYNDYFLITFRLQVNHRYNYKIYVIDISITYCTPSNKQCITRSETPCRRPLIWIQIVFCIIISFRFLPIILRHTIRAAW